MTGTKIINAAVWLISHQEIESRILLMQETGGRQQADRAFEWSTPGGRLNKDEDSFVGALRELREETGLDVKINSHPFSHPSASLASITYRTDTSPAIIMTKPAIIMTKPVDLNPSTVGYIILTRVDVPIELSPEHIDSKWVKISDILNDNFEKGDTKGPNPLRKYTKNSFATNKDLLTSL